MVGTRRVTGGSRPLAPVAKPDDVRDLGPVEVGPIIELLERWSERVWEVENRSKENDFAVFHHTEHVILRFLRDQHDATSVYSRPMWAIAAPTLRPIIDAAVRPLHLVEPVITKALFARLLPRSVIDRHRDVARSHVVTHKIHVPVESDPTVVFEVGGRSTHLEVGRAYEVNNLRHHSASNPSDRPRVHFIFEVFDASASDDELPR